MSRHWEHLRKAAGLQGMGHGAVDLGTSIFMGLQRSLCFILQKGYCLAQAEGHQTGMCLSLYHHRGRYPIESEDEHRALCLGQGATGSPTSPLLKMAFISTLTLLLHLYLCHPSEWPCPSPSDSLWSLPDQWS